VRRSVEKLLDVGEVADQLSVSRQSVWKLIRSGHLAAVRISERRIRIHPDDLKRFVDEQRAGRMSELPEHVRQQVQRVLDREARRLLAERLEREAEGNPGAVVETEVAP
jgi:excisionase family DNA binding protein